MMQKFKYQKIPISIMNQQINLRLPGKLLTATKSYARKMGYGTIQELIKEAIREKVFGDELTSKEQKLVLEALDKAKKNNDYVSEEEIFAELRRK
jgi:hypothetical protein